MGFNFVPVITWTSIIGKSEDVPHLMRQPDLFSACSPSVNFFNVVQGGHGLGHFA